MTLHLSDTLDLPLEWLLLAAVGYGMPGTGKSVLARVIAEEAAKAGVRFCIHDLKGDHYGLKSSADGKRDGLPVVVFGGDHADMPLNIRAGKEMGAVVAELEQSCIIDYEHFDSTEYLGFIADFSRSLYHHNRNPLVSIYDEVQEMAPQNPDGTKDAKRCLAAIKSFAKLGRKHACGRIFLTQRGAGINKDISEICETMISFRAPGTLDQDRIKKWLGSKLPKERIQELVAGLNNLPTGTALFASAHPKVNTFGFHAVRSPETFDSSSTPELGKKRAEPARLAKPALEELARRLAETIDEAQNEDPGALRAALAEEKAKRLSAEIALAQRETAAAPAPPPMEVPMWDPEAFAEFEGKIIDHWKLAVNNVRGALHVYKSKCMESNGAKWGLGGTPRERQTRLLAREDVIVKEWGPGGEPPRRPAAVRVRGGGGGGGAAGPIHGSDGRAVAHSPTAGGGAGAKDRSWQLDYPPMKGWTMEEETLYQKFKARLLKEAQEDPAILRVLAQCPELEVSQEKVMVEVDGKSLRGRIAQLAAQGFFADERPPGHVFKELNRTGPGVNSGNVSKELAKLVGFGILTRESDGFRIAPGAKVRLKKAG
jgi:hypothetical protein